MTSDDLQKLKIEKKNVQKKGNKKVVALAACVLIAVLAVVGFLRKPVEVQTATVSQTYPSQTVTLLNASGYVVAQRKAAVSAKVTSRLEWLGVEEGSRVRAGQIVARLECRDVVASRDYALASLDSARAELEQARAELDDATLSFGRLRDLLAQGVVSRSDYDSAEARLRKARAGVRAAELNASARSSSLRGAETAIEYTVIRAPFDGVILTKNADVGDIVTPLGAAADAKAAVVTVADLSSLQVEADVSEANLSKIKVGQPCELQLDALPDKRLRGLVHTIVPTADRSKATVLVKVRFLDIGPEILPEMSAKVAFLQRAVTNAEQRPITTVPAAAVVSTPEGQFVFLVKDGVAHKTAVKTGRKLNDQFEVLTGVSQGEKIILSPLAKMKDGIKVRQSEK